MVIHHIEFTPISRKGPNEDHGFRLFKPWKRLKTLMVTVLIECIPNHGFLGIPHTRNDSRPQHGPTLPLQRKDHAMNQPIITLTVSVDHHTDWNALFSR
ncbi:hypothetical protein QCA50_015658 [Cerrena zonata]|uniref:Uncharacterized protein n=1 Tax=Cerrena zonata TaxID=2478898 RepID=A0AAW0FVB1_9APHY